MTGWNIGLFLFICFPQCQLLALFLSLLSSVPLQMQNRMAILMCNLKPAKMRGVVSQAMVMCASSPDKVEILDPPSGAVPGDRITFQGFPGNASCCAAKRCRARSKSASCLRRVCYLFLFCFFVLRLNLWTFNHTSLLGGSCLQAATSNCGLLLWALRRECTQVARQPF